MMPFSREQFLAVFGDYNAAVWPAQLVLYLLAVAALALPLLAPRAARRGVMAILGLLWLWAGAVYHLRFFAPVNPAARVFGAFFLLEAGMFLWAAIGRNRLELEARRGWPAWLAAGLAGYALVGYPLLGLAAGHRPHQLPVLGVPCPTTILTLAVFFLISPRWPGLLLAIPLAWSAIGGSAAMVLGVPQDFGLWLAGLATLLLARRLAARDSRAAERRPGSLLRPRSRTAPQPPPSRPSPALPRR